MTADRVTRDTGTVRDLLRGGGGYLLGATFVQAVGQGAAMACNAVFFVTVVGLGPAEYGVTHSVAAVVAMAAAVAFGRLTDRWGARNTAIWLAVAGACAVAAYAVVYDLVGFVLVQLLVSSLRMGRQIGEHTLVGQLVDGRARFRAYQRSVLNAGMALGTLAATVPLYLDSRAAFLAVIFFNAAALVVGGLLLRAVPGPARVTARRSRTDWRAVRDLRYVGVGLLCGLLEVRDGILTIALPLWLASSVDAPRPMAAYLLFLNTALVIVSQVRASRGAAELPGAAVTVARGGAALGLSCVVIGAASFLLDWWAVVALLGAMVCFTLGEMWCAAASWTFSYDLADPRAQGEYQGVFGMTTGVGQLVGPVVATTVALAFGVWGWLFIGLGFLAAGLAAGRVVRRIGPGHDAAPRVPAASTRS